MGLFRKKNNGAKEEKKALRGAGKTVSVLSVCGSGTVSSTMIAVNGISCLLNISS